MDGKARTLCVASPSTRLDHTPIQPVCRPAESTRRAAVPQTNTQARAAKELPSSIILLGLVGTLVAASSFLACCHALSWSTAHATILFAQHIYTDDKDKSYASVGGGISFLCCFWLGLGRTFLVAGHEGGNKKQRVTVLILPPKQAGLAEEVWVVFAKEEGQQSAGVTAGSLLLYSSSEDQRELVCWGGMVRAVTGRGEKKKREEKAAKERGRDGVVALNK